MTVDQHGMSRIELAQHLVGDLGGPIRHVFDLRRLQVIIHRYTILIWHNGMEGNVLGTVEDGFDLVSAEPVGIVCRLPPTDPHTWYDLVGVLFW